MVSYETPLETLTRLIPRMEQRTRLAFQQLVRCARQMGAAFWESKRRLWLEYVEYTREHERCLAEPRITCASCARSYCLHGTNAFYSGAYGICRGCDVWLWPNPFNPACAALAREHGLYEGTAPPPLDLPTPVPSELAMSAERAAQADVAWLAVEHVWDQRDWDDAAAEWQQFLAENKVHARCAFAGQLRCEGCDRSYCSCLAFHVREGGVCCLACDQHLRPNPYNPRNAVRYHRSRPPTPFPDPVLEEEERPLPPCLRLLPQRRHRTRGKGSTYRTLAKAILPYLLDRVGKTARDGEGFATPTTVMMMTTTPPPTLSLQASSRPLRLFDEVRPPPQQQQHHA